MKYKMATYEEAKRTRRKLNQDIAEMAGLLAVKIPRMALNAHAGKQRCCRTGYT